MTQYNTLSIKLSNSQLNELKSGKRNNTEITLKTSLNVVGDSNHSHKKRKDILETRAQPAIICVFYVENQAILQPILLYRTSKWKQTKEQDSDDCLWTHIFTFLCDYYTFFFSFFCQNVNMTESDCAIIGCNLSKKHELALSQR